MQRIVRIRKPVQRQNARRHITRIAANYRRLVTEGGMHVPASGFEIAARIVVLHAFKAYRVSSWRAIQSRAEG